LPKTTKGIIKMDHYKCEKCGKIFDEFEMNFRLAQIDKKCWCENCRTEEDLLQWKQVAKMLADELNEVNSEKFPISWEDASESSPAWIAYCNLRDRNI
jgi:DNA-directed RNA polymerase subunit RPC12/RpoP